MQTKFTYFILEKNLTKLWVFLLLLLHFLVPGTAAAQTFVHPGVPFTLADLNQLKANITKEPWLTGYTALKNDAHSQLTYNMEGPFATVTRAPNLNNPQWLSDMEAIHNLAFMYVFTGDSTYARKATNMLDSWAVTNTTWGGNESMLDIGDQAPYFIVGADILRSTFPGWSAANDAHVNNYFRNVLYPTSFVPNPLRDQNKGALQLSIAVGIAAYLGDPVLWQQAITVYRMDAGGGLRNSLPNGEVGDAGRDDHWFAQIQALGWSAEVAWKQGYDLFAEFNNRLFNIGELYNQYSQSPAGSIPFIPFGGYSAYWTNWGISPGYIHQSFFNNIIQGAYALRKGIPTPYTTQMRALSGEGSLSFLYLKSSDTSHATALTPIVYPADNAQPVSYLTNLDIGNTGITGTASYDNGTWTASGAGNSAANSCNYSFRQANGDVGMIVKVNSNTLNSAINGLMIRDGLTGTANYIAVGLSGTAGVTSTGNGFNGHTEYTHPEPVTPWWLKIERVGNRIFTYHSKDGINWTNNALYVFTTLSANTYIGFYTISNNTSSLNTVTFTNVSINNTSPAGAPVITSATAANGIVGNAFNYTIGITGTATKYAATNLPAGLSIDTLSGVISGTPTAIGQSIASLQATNSSGTGTANLVITVTANTAPAAPVGVTAAISNTTNIVISWPAVTNASTYNVKRSLSASGPFTTVLSGVTGTTYTDAQPVPEVNNYYVVTALAGTLESGNSNVVFASVPPSAPSQPTIVDKNKEIDLSWNAAAGAATYNLKRATLSGGPFTIIANLSSTSYIDLNVTNGTPYYYVVSSVGQTKESANSLEAFGVPGSSSFTWSANAATGSMQTASNWVENMAPTSPAIITFPASADTVITDDIPKLAASRIQFSSNANSYVISGDTIHLRNDLINNSSITQTLNTPIVLDTLLNVNTIGNNGTISLKGTISGNGSLLKNGIGFLYLSGNNTYSGGTILKGSGQNFPPIYGMEVSGVSTGSPSAPTSGPLGTGIITMSGGALFSTVADATLYNDIFIAPGTTSYFYQTTNAINLYGKLTGSGAIIQDGNTYAGLNLYGDNSGFTGYFVSKLRSGESRTAFEVPQSGSANASWNLDANGNDCQRILFATGTISFGSLSGRGAIRTDGGGSPTISIGALNIMTNFGGTMTGTMNVVKLGTAELIFSGNQSYVGTTTVNGGQFLISNDPKSGTFISPVTVTAGALGGSGQSTAAATIGTGSGTGALLQPGNLGIGTLKVGALTLKQDATYNVEFSAGSGTSDQVFATTVNLANNPQLTVTATDTAALASGASFVIVNNTGSSPVSGIFKNLPEMSLITVGKYNFRISYKGGTGNDVVLLDDRTATVTITSNLIDTVVIGRQVTYTITAIKSPNSFSATGLPAGLTINTATGVISGTPTQSGVFPVSIGATNGTSSDSQTLVLTVQSNAISGLIAAAGDAQDIIRWTPISNFSYIVQRSLTSGGPYTNVATVNHPIYTDVNVTNGTFYYYTVSSVDSTQLGPNSLEVVAKPNVGQRSDYKFDETNGTTAIDSWDANDASLTVGASRATGKFGQSLFLNGAATAYATLPAGITSTFNDFTISAWVRMDAISTWMRIFDFGNSTTQYSFLTVQAAVTSGKSTIRFAMKNGSPAEQDLNYNYTFPLNTWTQLAVTRSGNTCTLYVNGAAVASTTGITIKLSDLGITSLNYLGKSQFSGDPMFKGSIDEFKIYNRALSAAEMVNSLTDDQIITFPVFASKTIGDPDFSPAATASSGLPVTYTSSDTTIASIVNGNIHIVTAGAVVITASQVGNSSYQAALPVNQALTIARKDQSITFNALTSKKPGDPDFTVMATASSGLPVTFTISNPAVATVNGATIHIVAPGTTLIKAIQAGNATYRDTSFTQQLTVSQLNLKLLAMDGDNGNVSNDLIKPYLEIANQDSVAIPYQQLTVRYWFTPENYTGINTWIDYAQLGNNNVKAVYVPLSSPMVNALGYVEYSFYSSAGNLVAGANSGPIESRFANTDWSNQNESNDYSYASASSYIQNSNITIYRNGTLVWGTEPALATPQLNLKIMAENKTSSGNTISDYLSLENQGNVPVNYNDLSVRYFFTDEGAKPLNFYLDYAKLGNAISGKFVSMSPAATNADTYLELKVDSSAGILYPLSSSGNIQFRIAKTDWSFFDQSNDYSYQAGGSSENNHICVYDKGQLVYGIEPAALASNQLSLASLPNTSVSDSTNQISDVVVSKALSPNGDGIDDVLKIGGIENHPTNHLEIVSSNGMRVFDIRNYDNSSHVFTGRSNINGKMASAGTYFYLLEVNDKGKMAHQTGYFVLKYTN